MPQVTDMKDDDSVIRPKAGAPPKKATPKPRPKIGERDENGEKVRSPADRKLATDLAGMYQGLGVAVMGIGASRATETSPKGDEGIAGVGLAMFQNADAAALAWLDLADQNPAVKKYLSRITEASAVGSLVAVHFAMALPLLVDRGVVPAPVAAVTGAMFAQQNGGEQNGGMASS